MISTAIPILLSSSTTNTSDTDVSSVVDGVSSLAEAIDSYGPLAVALSVFILICFGLSMWMYKSNKKLLEDVIKEKENYSNILQKQSETMLTAVLERLENVPSTTATPVSDDGHPTDKRKMTEISINVNLAFKDASKIAMETTKAKRVSIYLFHNGNSSIHGFPFLKMTCIHEWPHSMCVDSRSMYHTNIPLHMFSDIIENISDSGNYSIGNIAFLPPSSDVLDFAKFSTAKAFYFHGITDEDDNLAGFIACEFSHEINFDDECENTLITDAVNTMADNIKSIVTNNDFRNSLTNS